MYVGKPMFDRFRSNRNTHNKATSRDTERKQGKMSRERKGLEVWSMSTPAERFRRVPVSVCALDYRNYDIGIFFNSSEIRYLEYGLTISIICRRYS